MSYLGAILKTPIIALILLLSVALIWVPRKSVEAKLVIAAPPEVIWAALTDTDGYAEWNPIFVKLMGVMRPGNELMLDMKLEDGRTSQVTVTLDAKQPHRNIQQSAGVPGILTAHHEWRLEPSQEGTLLVQREMYRGVGVLLYDPAYVELLYLEGLHKLSQRLTGL